MTGLSEGSLMLACAPTVKSVIWMSVVPEGFMCRGLYER